jgi:hypothetical protein
MRAPWPRPPSEAKIDWLLVANLVALINERCGSDLDTKRYLGTVLDYITQPEQAPPPERRRRAGPHPNTEKLEKLWDGLVKDLEKRHGSAEARQMAAEVFTESGAFGTPPEGQDALTWIEGKVKYARRSMRRRGAI